MIFHNYTNHLNLFQVVFFCISHLLTVWFMWYNEVRDFPRFRRVYGIQDKLAGETSISVSFLYTC